MFPIKLTDHKVFYPTFISNYDEVENFLDRMSENGLALVDYYRWVYTFTKSNYRRKYMFFDFPYRDQIKSDHDIRWSISDLKIPSKKWKINSSNRMIYEIKPDFDFIVLNELKRKRNTVGLRILKNHLGISSTLFFGSFICLIDGRLMNLTHPYLIGIVIGFILALIYIVFTLFQVLKISHQLREDVKF